VREGSITARAPLVTRPRLALRRLTLPGAWADRAAAARGFVLFAVCVQVGLTVGLELMLASRRTGLAPLLARGPVPSWLIGPLHGIAPTVPLHRWALDGLFAALLVGMIVCYLIALAGARHLSARTVVGAILIMHAAILLAPPVILTDVFNYIDTARLGAVHGLNPYTHVAADVPNDPVYQWVTWHHMHTPYGPLWTLGSYLLVPLGIAGSYWGLKTVVVLASLGCVWLLWRCAQALGRPAVPAIILVGLNPLLLVYGVGGFHNDFFMVLAVLAATLLVVRGRSGLGGAMAVAAPLVKLSAGVFTPFLLLGARRRGAALAGAALCGAILVATTIAVFGTRYPGVKAQVSVIVGPYSIPSELGLIFGYGINATTRHVVAALLIVTVVALLVRTWRGADWITTAGWAGLAFAVAQLQPMPWYLAWPLPFAALSRSRPLRVATLLFGLTLLINCSPQQNLFLTRDLGLPGIGPDAGRATRALLW